MSLLLRQDHFSSKGMSIILSKDGGHSPPKTIFDATIRVLEDICVSSESSSFSLCVWAGEGWRGSTRWGMWCVTDTIVCPLLPLVDMRGPVPSGNLDPGN